jgi:hypothetical protein
MTDKNKKDPAKEVQIVVEEKERGPFENFREVLAFQESASMAYIPCDFVKENIFQFTPLLKSNPNKILFLTGISYEKDINGLGNMNFRFGPKRTKLKCLGAEPVVLDQFTELDKKET